MGTKARYPFAEKIHTYQSFPMVSLLAAQRDAAKARDAAGDMDGGEVENWYADDVFTIADEIRGRRDGTRIRRLLRT